MEDKDLFELCKQVYEKTRWIDHDSNKSYVKWISDFDWSLQSVPCGTIVFEWYPLYTSDYLLTKLPYRVVSKEYQGRFAELRFGKTDAEMFHAWYYVIGVVDVLSDFGESSDTLVKALLKLTLVLHEAGELK